MSTRLVVQEFSCIQHADMTLNVLTILIGPQASGKSIISKLIFFFNQLLYDQLQSIEDCLGLPAFKEQLRDRFCEWFPIEAWGSKKFSIEFYTGEFHVRINRIERKKKASDKVRVWLSPFFENQYNVSLSTMDKLRKTEITQAVESFWKVQESAISSLKATLKDDFFEIQTFIPAGRSFFTSIGKSIAAFEYGRVLDPLIMRFGRYFARLRERSSLRVTSADRASPWISHLQEVMGGEIVVERNREYLKASDGRKIPISALSSGQQELMPLMMALRARNPSLRKYRQLMTIEEPEAHLFPEAQSKLVEALSSMLNAHRGSMSLLVTTHSPYVLAKVNNLIKASQVAMLSEEKASKVARIIPRRAWTPATFVSAYAICEGQLRSIVDDEEKLIDGSYLDDVSGEISREFSELLALEFVS